MVLKASEKGLLNNRPFSHFCVQRAEVSNSSVKKLPLQWLSVAVPTAGDCFSTDTSSKDTKINLKSLIEYCQTKETNFVT